MIKKALAIAGAGAILLSMAGPAFGCWWCWPSDDIDIWNRAKVHTRIYNKADTGDNEVHGEYVFGGRIRTGDARATSTVYNDVNYNDVGCGCMDGDVDIHNRARVGTRIYNKADSGDNEVHGKVVCGGRIRTGAATATSMVDNLVNTNIVGVDGGE